MRRPSPTPSLAALATRQHGVLARAQLLEAGLSPSAVDRRIRDGALHAIHYGVYALGHPVLRREGRWMAAVLAGGPGAALSHWDAAAAWDLAPPHDGGVHVVVHYRLCRRVEGLVAHGTRALPSDEVERLGPLRVTSVSRTLVDLAGRASDRRLEQLISDADLRQVFDLADARRVVDRYPTRRGATRLRRLLARLEGVGAAFTRSELEIAFLAMCDRYDLPLPRANAHVHGMEVDFWWPDAGVVVETDSWRWHRMPGRREEDAAKRLRLQAAGLRVIVLTYAQVRDTPEAVAASLRPLITSGRRP